jgi:hypothetical protein
MTDSIGIFGDFYYNFTRAVLKQKRNISTLARISFKRAKFANTPSPTGRKGWSKSKKKLKNP